MSIVDTKKALRTGKILRAQQNRNMVHALSVYSIRMYLASARSSFGEVYSGTKRTPGRRRPLDPISAGGRSARDNADNPPRARVKSAHRKQRSGTVQFPRRRPASRCRDGATSWSNAIGNKNAFSTVVLLLCNTRHSEPCSHRHEGCNRPTTRYGKGSPFCVTDKIYGIDND